MIFFDRIKNSEVKLKDIKQPIILGRYIIVSNIENIFINEEKELNDTFFVPSNNLNALIGNENRIEKKISFHSNKLITDKDSLLINTFSEITDELGNINKLEDINEISPLLRNFDKRLEITEFDEFVHKYLFHIEEICREPSYHLKRDITKVNIARAKRIPVKAINYLASHSEDWANRKIRTVQPNRVLSEIIEYDLDIYENRVTAVLIDSLLTYFNKRIIDDIDVIEEFLKKIDEIIESRSLASSGSKFWYKKLKRDYYKIGNVVDRIENSRKQLDKIKLYIKNIQKRLFALLTSDLYRNNRKNRIVDNSLERTNLFDNHKHYRYIKFIWNKIYKNDSKSYSEIAMENRRVINSFIDFSWIVIIQALIELGFIESEKLDIKHYILKNRKYPFIKTEIRETETKSINIQFEKEEISFISLPIESEIDELTENSNNYFLTLSKSINSKNIIKISPEDINSVDRVTEIFFEKIFFKFIDKYRTSFEDNKEYFSTCISCGLKNGNLHTDKNNGFKFLCSKKGCEVEYGFKKENIFYRVKDYKAILSNGDIENRIGYEYLGDME